MSTTPEGQNGQATPPANTAVERPRSMMAPAAYEQYADKWKGYAGRQEESAFKREVYFLTQAISNSVMLQQATPVSIVECLMNAAQFNLSLNPALKLCYVIPRKVKTAQGDVVEAKLEPSYMGMAKMLVDAGAVLEVQAENIWEGDSFQLDMSRDRKVSDHHPYWENGAVKGEHRATYSTAYLPDGRVSQCVMPYDEIVAIMQQSEGWRAAEKQWDNKPPKRNSVWHLHFGEQAKKTCLRRHFKLLPKSASAKLEAIAKVIDIQEEDFVVQRSTPAPTPARPQHDVWAPAKMTAAKQALNADPPECTLDDLLAQHPTLHPDQVEELRASVEPFKLSTNA